MIQLLLHLLGDYVLQSHWMAVNKTKASLPCAIHVALYSLPFLAIGSWRAVAFIAGTHFLIDRFQLARYVVYAKNVALGPAPFAMTATGFPADTPDWLAVILRIVVDNTIHLSCNYLALRLL